MNDTVQNCSGCGAVIKIFTHTGCDVIVDDSATGKRHTVEECLRRQLAAMTAKRDAAVAESVQRRDVLVSIAKLYDETLAAIVQMFKHISDDGGVAGLDWIGNYLNGVDAVQEGDDEIWQSARDRLARESAAQPAMRSALKQLENR